MITIHDYLNSYASGTMTPSAAIESVYARIAAHDDPAIFITLRPIADVLKDARELERRGSSGLPLFGVPVAVKDNIDVAGLPTTAACPDFAYTPAKDAMAVAKLREAGALIIGKTNLDQFAAGLVGVRSPYGVPRNTLNAELVPGGSSSGSAVAVAAGLVPIAFGTDTAGSGRVPAGLNNIVGLKPTLGAISTSGVVPACRTLDCVSIFAHTVEDAYEVFQIVAGFDADDSLSRTIAVKPMAALPQRFRIGIPDAATISFGGDKLSEEAFSASLRDLTDLGAEIVPVDMTAFYDTAKLLYHGPWVAERYQGIRSFFETQPSSVHPVTRAIIESATAFSAADAFAGRYTLADLRSKTEGLWRNIDMLALPTFPRPQTVAALAADPMGPNSELGTYTNFVNLLDLCGLAVPGRFRSDGLPAGITLIGRAGEDARLAALGAQLHQARGGKLGATGASLPPSTVTSAGTAPEGEIELVVVGAHMSGLVLNGELTSCGARLLRGVTTKPDYKLFALPGGPPARPGLLRVADGEGHPIAVEVWSLDPAGFGSFVSKVPSPLSIGTLRLSDGTSPKGFLVEAQATTAARDISSFGGWRAFTQSNG